MASSNEIINECKQKMKKSEDSLQKDLGEIRVGVANASILNPVNVSYYGAPTPLNQMASISIPEPRTILITPYDKSTLKDIEHGILEADLGINPMNDGDNIRIIIPQLTEERRQEVAKKVKSAGEEGKVAVRNVRHDSMDKIKRGHKDGDFTDDEEHGLEDKIQKITDNAIKDVEKIVSDKENDVLNG